MRQAALYLRVSTLDQTTANQKRPQFDALCRDATQRKFDMIMAWSVDRLGAHCRTWSPSCRTFTP
jgi:DNA invertase Pin-like site-specific DNA recombinase